MNKTDWYDVLWILSIITSFIYFAYHLGSWLGRNACAVIFGGIS